MNSADLNVRAGYDDLIQRIADYVMNPPQFSALARETAGYVLLDSIGCAALATGFEACQQVLGPMVPGVTPENGVPIIGTNYRLDPIQAAFNLATLIRWLDYNDTWLAAEWAHPSDNLGALLAVADYLSRVQSKPVDLSSLLEAMIQAHEIQGVLALTNAFNRVGLDHVVLVKLASTAVCAKLLGCTREQILAAISQVWVDGQSLRTYRHAPNTGTRKSWAAGDAASRAVWLAFLSQRGEMGYPSALTAKTWGFQDASFRSQSVTISQSLSCYVMENVLFKIAYPAEFHAQTAVEAAIKLHHRYKDQYANLEKIVIETQEAAVRIISKTGPLYNPADRDHCIQYIVAIGLIHGGLTAQHYDNETAQNPEIDRLRSLMKVNENKLFTEDYHDPHKRSIANGIQLFFKDGTASEKVVVDYPLGHRTRRQEAIPLLLQKFRENMSTRYDAQRIETIQSMILDPSLLAHADVSGMLDALAV